ncbi:hypothetical protein E2562_019797 [Oryza meyeriana var. granulata]|uniref:Uncharacterized protein n=1 Tax=Oryza meyeriana var. granulata TaxID=110450 RepID=A0A6G1DKN2_9ORYZ|nr:hypothetical protein E2562_019797 [Oryza meyeriana var. granulata]
MVAIKHSQANQRRNPDTFHFYHQVATAQTPTTVKVKLLQLVLTILDDPIVSCVFGEAGFRSGDIKLAILRSTPPMLLLGRGLPTRSRPPPLFLCSFAAANDADVPSSTENLVDAGEENCRRVAEILSRGRNPMLVGVRAASATDDFAPASPYHIIHVEPNSTNKSDLGVAATIASTTSESKCSTAHRHNRSRIEIEVKTGGRPEAAACHPSFAVYQLAACRPLATVLVSPDARLCRPSSRSPLIHLRVAVLPIAGIEALRRKIPRAEGGIETMFSP